MSELEFYQNATQLRIELTRLVMNEKHVPKRYRFIFAQPIITMLRNLMNGIIAANTIYPTNDHELEQRRDYQTRAIIHCEQLLQELQYMMTVLPIGAETLRPATERIVAETRLLKAWRKTNKVMTSKS
ncbi:hypothetical protein LJC74_05690 [Eubacteriales bacterium OttesenSCG-928-A19]|nr:hypothetical protein [Eubacteriales bacterium OttesenSCG-928-A19]